MKNIILLDDHDMNSYLMSMVLNDFYEVQIHICSCVNDALIILNRYEIDLVLSDIMMPDIDGFEFVQYLSEHDEFKDVPVIFVSAIDLNNKTREKVENSNVKGFIPKPLVLEDVKDLLDEYLV